MIQSHKHTFLIFLFLSFCIGSYSQTKMFTEGELPSDMIYQITQDYDGYMWFATDRGIVKYDGTKTRIFSVNNGLPSNDIWMLNITENNKIWYYSKNHIQGYIYKDSIFSFEHEEKDKIFKGENYIQNKEEILYWDSPSNNLCQLIKNQWKVIEKSNEMALSKDTIRHTLINKYGIKYLAIIKDSLWIKDDNNKSYFILNECFGKHISINVTTNKIITLKVFTYNKKNIKIISHLFFDTKTKKLHQLNFGNYKPFQFQLSKLVYAKNRYQFSGTDFHCEIDSNFAIKNLTRINPVLKKHANFQDVSGNLWLGGLETGIHFIPANKKNTSIYHKNKKVRNLVVNNHQLNYILDDKYITRFNNTSPEIWLKEKTFIRSIFSIENNLTIHPGHITIPNIKYYQTNPIFYSSKKIILIDSNVFSINASGFYKTPISDYLFTDSVIKYDTYSGLHNQIINDIIKYKDTMFVATNNGLYYLKNKELIKHPVNFNTPILALGISKNLLLLGTSEYGLATYQNGKITNLKSKFTTESLHVYKDSIILVSTKKGMFYYINQESISLKHRFTRNDGLPTDHVLDAILYRDSLYIGTTKGLAVMPFKTIKTKAINPFCIENISWNDELISVEKIESYYRVINSLEIDFKSIQYEIENYDTYSYRLLPDQTSFQNLPTGHLNLRNIPIGDNVLELKITNCHGKDTIRSIPITILPKLYQRVWFFPGLVFAILILIFFYLRHQRIKRANKDLFKAKKYAELANFKLESLRSQMNPHFVFNSLNAIQYYINESDNKMSEKYLLKFSKLIRQFFDLSSEKEISIKKEGELLDNYLELEKMRFDPNLDYSIHIDPELIKNKTKVPTMLIQPIVENAVNHGIFHKGEKGRVEIKFEYTDKNAYKATITDDGIGIENSQKMKEKMLSGHKSKSTIIFKKRIELLNESKIWDITYSIENSRNHQDFPGTKVTLQITKL